MNGRGIDELRVLGADAAAHVVAAWDGLAVNGFGPSADALDRLSSAISKLVVDQQVGLLLTAVERMPRLRAAGDRREGPLMYAVAVLLYRSKLPLTADEIAFLLHNARHGCGHGADTAPPFELARQFQIEHGYSPQLAAAIKQFAAQLPATSSVTIQSLRRNAALLSVLDTDLSDLTGRQRTWWINQVRVSMSELNGHERRTWEQLVLSMRANETMKISRRWELTVRPILEASNRPGIHGRIQEWWPVGPVVSLDGSGAQLLKHFIWLLQLERPNGAEELVMSLADVQWRPRPQPMAVLKPATAFLAGAIAPSAAATRNRLLDEIATCTRTIRAVDIVEPSADVALPPSTRPSRLRRLFRRDQ